MMTGTTFIKMGSAYPCFDQEAAFHNHFDKELKKNVTMAVTSCNHRTTEIITFDDNRNEKVCELCGEVMPTEITEFDKLSGCLDGEDFLKVRYGPSTPPYIQSFLLPTIITKKEMQTYRMKMRDKFVDTAHLQKTRKYTDIQRLCQQNNIPNDYAVEVMRRLLRANKYIHSRFKPIEILIDVIKDHPQLSNRVPDLKKQTREGQKIERYLAEIKQLKRELKAERKKTNVNIVPRSKKK